MISHDGPIVVGTDGSPHADRAVDWAADEAAWRRRPLRVVHALERWFADVPGSSSARARDRAIEAAHGILDAAERRALKRQPDLMVTTEVLYETPWHALRLQAVRAAAEVVVGHRGRGGFGSLLLGSTGLQVAGHAPGPVVIVRGDAKPEQGELVVGIDHAGDEGGAALEYAFEAASLRGARLRVVHAWRIPAGLVEDGHAIALSHSEKSLRRAVADATGPLRRRHPDVEVSEEIVCDQPVAALADASREADLVVVGSHDRSGFGAFRLGSVSHGVIHHAHCPVAVVCPYPGPAYRTGLTA